ncbi:MAG TPA: glycosyltransferase family 2 protein [Abditibacteriaceae bacterium]|jgi:glycosyltransferase involved in cell wall biosynthesis
MPEVLAEFVPHLFSYEKIDAPMKVTLALLAYNEADAIEKTVREAAAHMTKQFAPDAWEILVIDDGSRDATPAVLERLAKEFSALRVYTHAPNRGYVEATRSAIREAKGEFVCVFDGDGQQTAADVPRFVQKLASGCDVVFGWKKQRFDPAERLVLSRGLRLCARYFLHTRLHDINAGCRGFRRSHAAIFLDIRHKINFIGPELYTRARLADLKIAEIVVRHAPREGGESSHPLGKIPGEVMQVIRYLRALRGELRAANKWRRFL